MQARNPDTLSEPIAVLLTQAQTEAETEAFLQPIAAIVVAAERLRAGGGATELRDLRARYGEHGP
jgi:hypothetical protein